VSREVLGMQFDTLEQQKEAYRIGGWIFVGTEVMLFSGLFLAYLIGRLAHPEGFAHASGHLDVMLGTLNTAVLLTSSYFMALAVTRAETQRHKTASIFLLVTALLGSAFLGIKIYEWWHEYHKAMVPGVRFDYLGPHLQATRLFLWTYFTATGLHALHLSIGIVVTLWFCLVCRFWPNLIPDPSPLVLGGLYWHLVDLIWIFLYPLLYLIGGPS
jgi:cytochrome c oxidase subunit III